MYSLPLDPEKKQKEWEIIQTIAKNNNFPQSLLQKLNRQIQHKVDCKQTEMKDKTNLDYIQLPQPKDNKNQQHVQKYQYRYSL
jgi:hypothetical protein